MLQRNPEIPSTELDGEQVFMDLDSGKYYSLRGTGLDIWQRLATPLTEADLYSALAADYQIDAARCAADCAPFIEQMLARGLLLRVAG